MPELKPCPFCGERKFLQIERWHVYCPECLTEGPEAADEDEAVEKWNRRFVNFPVD